MASHAAAAARSSVQPLTGIGSIIYRISSKKQEVKSQYESVENWLIRRKAQVDPVNVFDIVVKRRKTTQNVDFRRLIEWVQAGRINWVVVQDLDRFGSKDPYELMEFLGKLKEAGCQLWTVSEDKVMNDGSDEAILMAIIKGMTSEKECWVKSERSHRTKQDLTLDGRWLGGPIPYGFDVEARTEAGIPVWRFVLDRAIPVVETDKRGHKSKSFRFEGVMIQDGQETQVSSLPARNRKQGSAENAWLVESLRTDRREALELIFDQYVNAEASPYAIAKLLNSRGYNPVHGEKWYPERIKHILANPLYLGSPSSYKRSHSGYFRYAGLDEETGARLMGKAPNKAGKPVAYDRSEWIGPNKSIDPLIDPATVEASITRMLGKEPRPKAPKNAALWLSGLVVCHRCNRPMVGSMGGPDPKRKIIHRTYLCGTYIKYTGQHCPSGCKAHRTQHDVIERYLERYLTSQSKTLEDYKAARHNPAKLNSLLRRNDEALGLVVDYMNRMAKLVCSVQGTDGPNPPYHAGDFEEIMADLPNMLVCYEEAVESRKDNLAEKIREKEAEFDAMLDGFRGLTNERAIRQANERMEALDIEIKGLQAELPGLSHKVYSLFDELTDLHARIGDARLAMQVGSDQAKAEAARKAIKEIRLEFRYEDHGAKSWSKLDTITIVPRIGEAARFQVEGLPSAGRSKANPTEQGVSESVKKESTSRRT